MLTPPEPLKKDKRGDKEEEDEYQEEEEEEEAKEPPSHLNVLWDEDDFGDEDEDDIMEEACIGNDYNLQIKGDLKKNDTPSTLKTNNKNTPSKQPSTDKALEKEKGKEKEKEKEKEITKEIVKEKEVTPSRRPISLDLTQKILGDLKLDYDVVEDLKKMKANITVFELCKITQLREQLRDALQTIQGPQDVVISNMKVTMK
jgi:hypothetical protein